MSLELWALFALFTFLFIAIFIQQITMDRTYGTKYALSNRGELPVEVSETVERLTRLVRNHVEGIALFIPLVSIAHFAGISNSFTVYASIGYAIARGLHLIFYSLGITPLRSIVWGLGFFIGLLAFCFGVISSALM